MPVYTIKHGSIWQGGKLRSVNETVELSEKDRELIDPKHTDLQSPEEAKAEAEAALEAAEKKAADAKALAEAEAKRVEALKKAKKDGEKKEGTK